MFNVIVFLVNNIQQYHALSMICCVPFNAVRWSGQWCISDSRRTSDKKYSCR